MGQKQKSFKEQLEFGQEGEHEIAFLLIKNGVSVLPLYQFNADHSPYIISNEQNLISPDLICFSNSCFMVEVKTKNQWVRFNGELETGISQRLYKHYSSIKKMTKHEVLLFFNHKAEEPTGVFYVHLNKYTRVWDGTFRGKNKYEPLVFYNYNVLNKVGVSGE